MDIAYQTKSNQKDTTASSRMGSFLFSLISFSRRELRKLKEKKEKKCIKHPLISLISVHSSSSSSSSSSSYTYHSNRYFRYTQIYTKQIQQKEIHFHISFSIFPTSNIGNNLATSQRQRRDIHAPPPPDALPRLVAMHRPRRAIVGQTAASRTNQTLRARDE